MRYLLTAVTLSVGLVWVLVAGCGKREEPVSPQAGSGPKAAKEAHGPAAGRKDAVKPARRVVKQPVKPDVNKVLADLKSPDKQKRLDAVGNLIEIGDRTVEHALRDALNDKDVEVRAATAQQLTFLPDQTLAAELMTLAMQDPSDEIRLSVTQSLSFLEDLSKGLPVLEKAVKDRKADVRVEAIAVIGEADVKSFAPLLIELVNDADKTVRAKAADALTTLTGEEFGADHAAWNTWWKEKGKDLTF